jgi:hypothetical protein
VAVPSPVTDAQLTSIERPLLERAWAKAKLELLQAQLDAADGKPQRDAVKKQIVELSTKSRVLCSLTALLVLETEADYARFKHRPPRARRHSHRAEGSGDSC